MFSFYILTSPLQVGCHGMSQLVTVGWLLFLDSSVTCDNIFLLANYVLYRKA